jgi:N6-adenosine-specific RNA methylase IME4
MVWGGRRWIMGLTERLVLLRKGKDALTKILDSRDIQETARNQAKLAELVEEIRKIRNEIESFCREEKPDWKEN